MCPRNVVKYASNSWKAYAKARFCSRLCFTSSLRGKPQSPEWIAKRAAKLKGRTYSKEFIAKQRRAKLGKHMSLSTRRKLSLIHRQRVHDGLHWNYNGYSTLAHLIRSSAEYRIWRTSVYERDHYRCQQCPNLEKSKLNADHIISFATILQTHSVKTLDQALACAPLWDVNNGRTLCVPCHQKTSSFLRRISHHTTVYE